MLMSSGYSIRLSLRGRSTLNLRNVWEGNSKIRLTGMAAVYVLGKILVCDWKVDQTPVFLWSAEYSKQI